MKPQTYVKPMSDERPVVAVLNTIRQDQTLSDEQCRAIDRAIELLSSDERPDVQQALEAVRETWELGPLWTRAERDARLDALIAAVRADSEAEIRRLREALEEITRELDASEPQPRGGQHVGPMASHWNMTPTTRKALRRILAAAATGRHELLVDVCKCGRAKDSIWHYFTDQPGPDDLGAHRFEFSYSAPEWREKKLTGRPEQS